MSEFIYTITDIFKFPIGTKFKDEEGNTYKIFQDKEHCSKTLKYAIMSEKLLNSKFKIIN